MAVEWSNPLLCQPVPCGGVCPASCPPQYQPLPISTGTVGIDRCGNIEVYAAPNTVHRQVCWPTCTWPIPYQGGWGSGWYGGGLGALAQVMTGGAAMADGMIQRRRGP